MFRNLIDDLSDSYHLLAPDYPGYGRSEQPPMSEFDYTFDNMAVLIEGFLKKKGVDDRDVKIILSEPCVFLIQSCQDSLLL